jgi:serpin B
MRAVALSFLLLLPVSAIAAPASDAELGFAARLYAEVGKQAGNLFFSPTSIRMCLGLAYAGARGQTAEQMRKTLGFAEGKAAHEAVLVQLRRWDELGRPKLPDGANGADPSMQKYWEEELAKRTTQLHIANRLWAQKGHPLRADYLSLLEHDYRASAVAADFVNATEAVRVEINKWVSDKTEHKIKELIPARMLTSDTRTVLVNAIYFKASWEDPFEPSRTKKEPFFVTGGRSVEAPLMHHTEHFSLAKLDSASLLQLPYGDGKLAMVIVLPKTKDGLAQVEKQIAGGALPGWLSKLSGERVDVTLPKFKVSGSFSLREALEHLGMPLPFTFPGADFSGIDDTKQLFISQVVHQAVVNLDEKGTEAAAATATSMKAGGMPSQPAVFRADHPFVFLIRDIETGAVLFMGRLVDPTAS